MDSSLERLEDLLIRRSLEGIDETAARELRRLIAKHPQIDVEAFDRAAAAISVARVPVVAEMPARLYASIEAAGIAMVAQNCADTNRRTETRRSSGALESASKPGRRRANPALPRFALWVVAAASLVAAIIAWWPADLSDPQAVFAERRESLIAAGARAASWTATDEVTAAAAAGDVVWDDGRQEGYMRIVMLSANDPQAFQYQLWIFDAERDDRYPVDGGTFDVPPESGEIIVPIRAKLPVGRAAVFAITVERPGGVVVSDRQRIALIAEFG